MNCSGMDRRDGKGLAELMAELGKLEGLEWMRILYAYPSYFSDALIDEIANNPKVGCLSKVPPADCRHRQGLLDNVTPHMCISLDIGGFPCLSGRAKASWT